jgi:hypothetical protein
MTPKSDSFFAQLSLFTSPMDRYVTDSPTVSMKHVAAASVLGRPRERLLTHGASLLPSVQALVESFCRYKAAEALRSERRMQGLGPPRGGLVSHQIFMEPCSGRREGDAPWDRTPRARLPTSHAECRRELVYFLLLFRGQYTADYLARAVEAVMAEVNQTENSRGRR